MINSITEFRTTCVGNNCTRVPILELELEYKHQFLSRFTTDIKFKWVVAMKNIRQELVQKSLSEKECLTSHTVSTAESCFEYRFSPGMRRIPTARQSTFMECNSFMDSVHSHLNTSCRSFTKRIS